METTARKIQDESSCVRTGGAGERQFAEHGGTVAGSSGAAANVQLWLKLMVWGAIAVAGVLLVLAEGLADYFKEEPVRPWRIAFRLLGMAGWAGVLYGFVKVIWNGRKRK